MAPSVLDKIMTVIKDQNTPGGSSRQAIAKGLKSKFGEVPANAVKTAIKKGVDTKKLVQSGQVDYRTQISRLLRNQEHSAVESGSMHVTDRLYCPLEQ